VPAHGTFPELIQDTGGGLLCEPHNGANLAEKLAELLQNPQRARKLGLAGQQAIRDRYHAEVMARRTLSLYEELRISAKPWGCNPRA